MDWKLSKRYPTPEDNLMKILSTLVEVFKEVVIRSKNFVSGLLGITVQGFSTISVS